MDRVALDGPMYSGKSSLARLLEAHGYFYINYTDILKGELVKALGAIGVHVSIEEIHADKKKYRPILQDLSELIGFNQGGRYIERSLEPWVLSGKSRVVFDNVRTDTQYEQLAKEGFNLVQLWLPRRVQIDRAAGLGVSVEELDHTSQHSIETGLYSRPDIVLDASEPLEQLVRKIMEYKPHGAALHYSHRS